MAGVLLAALLLVAAAGSHASETDKGKTSTTAPPHRSPCCITRVPDYHLAPAAPSTHVREHTR
jgi:hypothetical protein